MTAVIDRFRLDGKVAVVTGASRGLGAAIAVALAGAGADVVVAARSLERLKETVNAVQALGRRAVPFRMDITVAAECEALIVAAVEAFCRVDILVNNAGVSAVRPATRETPEEFRSVVECNLFGTYWCSQAFARAATEGGSIVNITSNIASRSAGIPQAAYASSKAGVEALTRDLAAQWGSRKGIRVNTVAPGYFATGMTGGMDDVMSQAMTAMAPLARTGVPEDVAAAVLYFASPASSYVTDATLTIDGGLSKAGSMFGTLPLR
jgi:NAD(P)-dependent dehydrogenase (short-subunit alcohol dehydrogenase family)